MDMLKFIKLKEDFENEFKGVELTYDPIFKIMVIHPKQKETLFGKEIVVLNKEK